MYERQVSMRVKFVTHITSCHLMSLHGQQGRVLASLARVDHHFLPQGADTLPVHRVRARVGLCTETATLQHPPILKAFCLFAERNYETMIFCNGGNE